MLADLYSVTGLKAGQLSIMAHPRGGDWLEDEIKALKQAEVNILVSLLTREKIVELNLGQEAALCQVASIEFLSLPIADRATPTSQAKFLELVQTLTKALDEGKHIAIHCRIGIGRSSMVAASALVLAGFSTEEAFDLVKSARGRPVPDTDEQYTWVKKFEQQVRG